MVVTIIDMRKRVSIRWHFWAIGVASLLWNAYGAYDYVMTNVRNADYLANFPPDLIDYLDGFPIWAMAAWAIGVWGAVAGSILLLMRSRFAVHAFAASLAGLAASMIYELTTIMFSWICTVEGAVLTGIVWAAAIFFLWYAVRMDRVRILR